LLVFIVAKIAVSLSSRQNEVVIRDGHGDTILVIDDNVPGNNVDRSDSAENDGCIAAGSKNAANRRGDLAWPEY
jgi:L-fucose mutarotase/ribose pyranase (RbsD/FucU family)